MAKRHELTSQDAIRLLTNAVQSVHYFEVNQEGQSIRCPDEGQLMLQDALKYLAFGDTEAARSLMTDYEEWLDTGIAKWPYDGGPPP